MVFLTEIKLIKVKKWILFEGRQLEMPFRNSKTLKIELSEYGSYLGRNEGCFELRRKNGKTEQYPHFEKQIGECVLKSGSYVSVNALIDLALWNIDT